MESLTNEQILLFNKYQQEILKLGWKGIVEKYHPDFNCEHPEAITIFLLYIKIYENMNKRLEIPQIKEA